MEQRLIDANALKDDLRESYNALKKIYDRLEHNEDRAICGGQLSTFLEAILRVKEAPTVDAVPVKNGRWEERPVNVGTCTTGLFCSECNFPSLGWRYNYCPYCGAKMTEVTNGLDQH